jgi:hypothetical protein
MRWVRRSLVESQFSCRGRSKRQEREGLFQLSSTLGAPTPGLTAVRGRAARHQKGSVLAFIGLRVDGFYILGNSAR